MTDVDDAKQYWPAECCHYTSEVTYYCQEMEFFNRNLGMLIRNDFEASFWHLEYSPVFTSTDKFASCLEESQISQLIN